MRLRDKVALITGAGSGMGKAMAELFTAEGARVVCADISGKQDEVASAIGDSAVAIRVDVSVENDVRRMIRTAEEHFGKLDILCNNAGFGGGLLPLAEQTAEHFDRVHGTNLKGVFYGMKYGILSMLKSGGGSIVNTASAVALTGMKGHSVYAAAKAGVVQITRCAALDYADQGIRINAICPGLTWTGLAGDTTAFPDPPSDRIARGVPMKRWGLAKDIAAAALFLASDEASFITGTALPVDGGYVAGISNSPSPED